MSRYNSSSGYAGSPSAGGTGSDEGLAYGSNDGGPYGERVPGARRQKVLGYIRAANELRQSYQSSLTEKYLQSDDADRAPGSFPDVDIVRSGDEEMLLFPSYARKHIKQNSRTRSERQNPMTSQAQGRDGSFQDPGDANYWRQEWEKLEDQNAVVDVDVRGWIYSPQKGPMTRRNRLLLAVARRLSGVPAPDTTSDDNLDTGSSASWRGPVHDNLMSQEEAAAAREADIIAQHGQREADAAWRGRYYAESTRSTSSSRTSSPPNSSNRTGTAHFANDESAIRPSAGSTQSEMSREEVVRANDQLMSRLRPFMTMPLANAPITVFFFNDNKSQSKSVTTDESGHFNLRAALDFVPTKVRVLASEKLSAVEDVIVTESQGISLVSDIDDTIKHSAIASGAKEIFKNTFIRDLGELTIEGVKDWYGKVAGMGVKLHYVSNSPWQLYPLLRSYFSLAGLPPGSFHLKQYSGMLQGIFEPAAERKRASMERIMYDFPERKFILVGDSGEADLEVYTDVVLANPGRILGVFIRDVTTPEIKHSTEQARAHVSNSTDVSDLPDRRPSLPSRSTTASSSNNLRAEESLIDFDDEHKQSQPLQRSQSSYADDMQQLRLDGNVPPTRPTKPSNLRSYTTSTQQAGGLDRIDRDTSSGVGAKRTPPPPPPPRPRRSSKSIDMTSSRDNSFSQQPQTAPLQRQGSPARPAPPRRGPSNLTQSSNYSSYAQREDEGYAASARRHLVNAYNAIPQIRSQSPGSDSASQFRGLSSYPAAAARWATGATGGDPAAGGDGGIPGAPYNKKEEMWKRRWANAEDVMKKHGVVLRTWRVGVDVMDECVRLIEKAQKES